MPSISAVLMIGIEQRISGDAIATYMLNIAADRNRRYTLSPPGAGPPHPRKFRRDRQCDVWVMEVNR